MAGYSIRSCLQITLEKQGERIRKSKSDVLFRRGEQGRGMFLVLSGKVSLDFGVDSAFARTYGPGALVGLPATLTRQNYSMTATVTEDAELGYWNFKALDSLLQKNPAFCQELIAILGERMEENRKIAKSLLAREFQPVQSSNVV
jgi:CRP-like cAMP-binding protein